MIEYKDINTKNLTDELKGLMDIYGCRGQRDEDDTLNKYLDDNFDGEINKHISYILNKYRDIITKIDRDNISYGYYFNAYIISFIDIQGEINLISIEIEDC